MTTRLTSATLILSTLVQYARSGWLGGAFFCIVLLAHYAAAQNPQVLFVHTAEDLDLQPAVQSASEFYGATLVPVRVGGATEAAKKQRLTENSRIRATVITAAALGSVTPADVIDSTAKGPSVLIIGIDSGTQPALLQRWSGQTVRSCSPLATEAKEVLRVTDTPALVHELAGQEFPARASCTFEIAGSTPVQALLTTNIPEARATFVVTQTAAGAAYFLAARPSPVPGAPRLDRFGELAPLLIYLRAALGEYAWHGRGSYANFTVDDPWLREPYGFLSYEGLLRNMKEARFHTTIAFIPWNFQRNEQHVLGLFKSNPKYFSLAVHGNNHLGHEFDISNTGEQEANIREAVARMEHFRSATGIPYSNAMIFPHYIGPDHALMLLKHYGFRGTVNSNNVPEGATAPVESTFGFRTATMAFSGFPSLRRYSAEVPLEETLVAADLFLGNPVLFYAHHRFFKAGGNAFNETANLVNRLEPGIQWTDLNTILERQMLIRKRADGNLDVRAFSPTIALSNDSDGEVTFYVERLENEPELLQGVVVDGSPESYKVVDGNLQSAVRVPPRQTLRFAVEYKPQFSIQDENAFRSSLIADVNRYLCDVRDIWLLPNPVGGAVVAALYTPGGRYGAASGALFLLVVIVFWYRRTRRARRAWTVRKLEGSSQES